MNGQGQRPRLVLASASPRREGSLREAGYAFVIHPSDVDEGDTPPGLTPAELASFLAAAKARAVADCFPTDVVLGADTVVALGEQTLGKPADADHARRMLAALSGTTHAVITGVAVVCRATGLNFERVVTSQVQMRALTPAEVEAYVAGGQWRGKAGGYGIQDQDPFVTRMSGSLSNIVGLPMEAVGEMLAGAGVLPSGAEDAQ